MGLLRGRERWSIDACPYSCRIFSLLFTTFFLSLRSFFLLLVSYSLVVGCSPFGLFFSWVPLSRCLLLSYYGFFPLGASPPWVPFFRCFSLFCVFPLPFPSAFFFCHGYLPFIAIWFNGISLFYPYGFTNCFWLVVGILSRLPTHPLVAPVIAQYMFVAPLLISWQNSLLFALAIYFYL